MTLAFPMASFVALDTQEISLSLFFSLLSPRLPWSFSYQYEDAGRKD